MLPPNLLELSAGNLASASCLLPLKELRQLTLEHINYNVASAAQLQQLSSLTALTAVDMTYHADADLIDAAAAGWQALKVRSLYLAPGDNGRFVRSTLLQLSHLTDLESLFIQTCGLGALDPERLADGVRGLRNLHSLHLSSVYWDSVEDDASNARSLVSMLRVLAARRHLMPQRTYLRLEKQRVGRAAAAALSQMHGLRRLELVDCQLDDGSAAKIALGLKPQLQHLDLSCNAQLTDACLPALADALPGLRMSSFKGCTGLTREGLLLYVLHAADDDD